MLARDVYKRQRLQGAKNIEVIRKRVDLPVIGIVKREYPGFEPYITPTLREVRELLNLGVGIVAFDATGRPRPGDAAIPQIIGEKMCIRDRARRSRRARTQ